MKTLSLLTAAVAWAGLALPLMAAPEVQLQFPAPSEETAQRRESQTSTRIALGPYAKGEITTEQASGNLQQVAWRLDMPRASTLELMGALRDQVIAAGFALRFECETDSCGGFDFRYSADILPEPDMHVDLGDFRYLAAERQGDKGKEYLSLMVSRSPQKGYVQLTHVGAGPQPMLTAKPDLLLTAATKGPSSAQPQVLALRPDAGAVAGQLDQGSPIVLENLVFDSGSARLTDGNYPTLEQLAAWLKSHPDKSVTLVGHTDASGSLANNVALSKKRAESVRQFLVQELGVPAAAIAANGVGPLAPRASNLDEAGRQKNRRVEVLPTSTQ